MRTSDVVRKFATPAGSYRLQKSFIIRSSLNVCQRAILNLSEKLHYLSTPRKSGFLRNERAPCTQDGTLQRLFFDGQF
ncbi:hypothetical protein L596_004125 [Steinernema carpocapsae]|uniref:Uncharacterized protein n=1 Tax=Steinernema carpocapsae TaxID=34508 RepID=A0A4U8UWD1_STECR|nr:hypothetical protein L596_004125 [Steinernema carpocapsae]